MDDDGKRTLADLHELIRRQELLIGHIEARLSRLLETAFRNPVNAGQELVRLLRDPARGYRVAIEISQGRHDLPRSLWLGTLRGGVFRRRERAQALAAIREMEPTLRELEEAETKIQDLEQQRAAYVANHPDLSREPARSPTRTPFRFAGRGRSRTRGRGG